MDTARRPVRKVRAIYIRATEISDLAQALGLFVTSLCGDTEQ